MLRALHKFPGLIAALLIVVMTLSGAVLSVLPALEGCAGPSTVRPRPDGGHAGGSHRCHLPRRRTDPPRTVGADHRVLL